MADTPKQSWWRRIPRWGWALIAVLLLVLLIGLWRAQARPAVTLATVTRGEVVAAVYAPGTVLSRTETVVAAAAAGRVTALYVGLGSTVAPGQVVARLDSAEAELRVQQAQQVVESARAQQAQAQAEVEAARARVDTARRNVEIQRRQLNSVQARIEATEARVTAARAVADNARDSLRRTRMLYERGAVAQRRVVEAETAYRSAQAQVNEAQAAVEVARQDVYAAQAAVDAALAQVEEAQRGVEAAQAGVRNAQAAVTAAEVRTSEARTVLSNYTVRSLVRGIVSETPVEVGDFVPVGGPVVEVVSPANLYVRADVDEADIGPVAVGQVTYFTTDANPERTYRGAVTRIGASAATETNTYPVDIGRIADTTGLRVNMSVDTNIVTRRNPDALLAPASAVVEEPEPHVWQVDTNKRLVRIEVVIGGRDADTGRVEILRGLLAGDRVVVDPQPDFAAGDRVTVRNP